MLLLYCFTLLACETEENIQSKKSIDEVFKEIELNLNKDISLEETVLDKMEVIRQGGSQEQAIALLKNLNQNIEFILENSRRIQKMNDKEFIREMLLSYQKSNYSIDRGLLLTIDRGSLLTIYDEIIQNVRTLLRRPNLTHLVKNEELIQSVQQFFLGGISLEDYNSLIEAKEKLFPLLINGSLDEHTISESLTGIENIFSRKKSMSSLLELYRLTFKDKIKEMNEEYFIKGMLDNYEESNYSVDKETLVETFKEINRQFIDVKSRSIGISSDDFKREQGRDYETLIYSIRKFFFGGISEENYNHLIGAKEKLFPLLLNSSFIEGTLSGYVELIRKAFLRKDMSLLLDVYRDILKKAIKKEVDGSTVGKETKKATLASANQIDNRSIFDTFDKLSSFKSRISENINMLEDVFRANMIEEEIAYLIDAGIISKDIDESAEIISDDKLNKIQEILNSGKDRRKLENLRKFGFTSSDSEMKVIYIFETELMTLNIIRKSRQFKQIEQLITKEKELLETFKKGITSKELSDELVPVYPLFFTPRREFFEKIRSNLQK